MAINNITKRCCKDCEETKPIKEFGFNRNPKYPESRRHRCIECEKEQTRRRNKRNYVKRKVAKMYKEKEEKEEKENELKEQIKIQEDEKIDRRKKSKDSIPSDESDISEEESIDVFENCKDKKLLVKKKKQTKFQIDDDLSEPEEKVPDKWTEFFNSPNNMFNNPEYLFDPDMIE